MNRGKSEGCRDGVGEDMYDLTILSCPETQPYPWG